MANRDRRTTYNLGDPMRTMFEPDPHLTEPIHAPEDLTHNEDDELEDPALVDQLRPRDDRLVHDEICRRLRADENIDASHLDVAVSKGVVTVRGKVPKEAMKKAIADLAQTVRGVREVIDELHVRD